MDEREVVNTTLRCPLDDKLNAGGDRSTRSDRSDTELDQTTDIPTNCSSPTMYHHPMPISPNLNLRQSSPYPVEGTNTGPQGLNGQPRHKNQHGYQHKKKSSLRNG
ncbi:hypothetical protein RUM44_002440 [Polyplax serrata]|uniref:Uncharacterized protein n=1 Tax=Polyplax serrata TaxID=468196 RepID=A0ABR1AEW0_POLSC